MSISGSNVNDGKLEVSYQQKNKDMGLYDVTFSYTSKDAKTVTLDCPDLYDRMLDADGKLKSLEKKPGTDTFVLKFDDIPKDAFFFYNIKVDGKVIIPEKDPEKTLPIYSNENASVASHESLYLRLPDASNPPWTTVEPNAQIQGMITKYKCEDTTTKTFDDRDVWVYEPNGFNEDGKGKVIFILDGKSFLESVTPYIDKMNQDPNSPFANTAFVFVDSKMDNRVFEFYLEENNKFSQFLTAQVIPTYKKKLGMEDSNNIILAAHSLAAYPVINVAKNNPDKISGVILLSPAINHNKDKALPENPSPPLSDLPIYMQIGQLESEPPPKAWLERGMTDESRLKANQDFHTMLASNNYNVEFNEHSSGHDAIHVIDGLEKGLRFVTKPKASYNNENPLKLPSNDHPPITTTNTSVKVNPSSDEELLKSSPSFNPLFIQAQKSISSLELNSLSVEFNIPAISEASISQTGNVHTNTAGATKETIFEAASLSKPVFAYMVLKMAERGEIDLDVPLYLQSKSGFGPPPLRESKEYQALTPRNILSHQAGLPNWFKSDAPEKYEAFPGTAFNYSGLAYCFLQEVIEERSGKSLDDLAQIELKDNLGMKHSGFYQPEENMNLALGHNVDGVQDKRSHYPKKSELDRDGKPYRANSAASLFTTPEDYSKFLIACIKDDFVRQHMFASAVQLSGNDTLGMASHVPDDYLKKMSWGLGMGLQQNDDGSKVAFHWGDSETFRNIAAIKFNKDGVYQSSICCFTNSANGPAVFRQVCEPVVGDLTAVSQWLAKREKLPINISSIPQVTEQSEHTGPAILPKYTSVVFQDQERQSPKGTDSVSQDITIKHKPNRY